MNLQRRLAPAGDERKKFTRRCRRRRQSSLESLLVFDLIAQTVFSLFLLFRVDSDSGAPACLPKFTIHYHNNNILLIKLKFKLLSYLFPIPL